MSATRRPTATLDAANGDAMQAIPAGLELFLKSSTERIRLMKQGVPATHLRALAQRMGISMAPLLATLRLSANSVRRKMQTKETLSIDESERVLGLEYLIGQVQNMVNESGDPTGFDAAKWLSSWLYSPVPALADQEPASYLETMEGQRLVSSLLAMTQSGAYA